jgi:uncharacterized protein YlaI
MNRSPNIDRVNEARVIAAIESLVNRPLAKQDAKVKKALKAAKLKSLRGIKDKILMARKPRMRTVEQYLCDECDSIISNESESLSGFVVHGNIYAADPTKRGGLIGNNIPEVGQDETINPREIKETVLCRSCFFNALGFTLDLGEIAGPIPPRYRAFNELRVPSSPPSEDRGTSHPAHRSLNPIPRRNESAEAPVDALHSIAAQESSHRRRQRWENEEMGRETGQDVPF